jgi:hypothetical protein
MLRLLLFLFKLSYAQAYTLSTASCVGNLSLLNTTIIDSLSFLFGDSANAITDFPNLTPCNLACIRNLKTKRITNGSFKSIRFSPFRGDKDECDCDKSKTIDFEANSSFAKDLGVYTVKEAVNQGLVIKLEIGGNSSIGCTMLYPVDDLPAVNTPAISSGVWDQGTKTVNAASSHFQTCGREKSCILNTVSVELSPGLWRIHSFAGMHCLNLHSSYVE